MHKFYVTPWFPVVVAICFALWFFIIPPIVGIILIIQYFIQFPNIEKHRTEIEQGIAAETYKYNTLIESNKAAIQAHTQGLLQERREAISELDSEVSRLSSEVFSRIYQLSQYEGITSAECKDRLAMLKSQEVSYVKENNRFYVKAPNNPKATRFLSNQIRQLLRCYNAECDNIILALSARNVDAMRSKVVKSFESANKMFEMDGVQMPKEMLEMKLEQLNLVYTFQLKKEQEQEEQRAIREQMVEEEKARREIERRRAIIEKDEAQFRKEVTKLMEYMQKSVNDVEKQLYVDKIRELEEKLKALEVEKKDVMEREQNARAGFVYIISNIGSFGEGVYKIGMTRRLEPMDRIKELGDASVPFPFDVHAMIFSADAPALETTLHQAFRDREVNKVNQRKEFFRVDLSEVSQLVTQNHNATVTFTMTAEAAQYRQSISDISNVANVV